MPGRFVHVAWRSPDSPMRTRSGYWCSSAPCSSASWQCAVSINRLYRRKLRTGERGRGGYWQRGQQCVRTPNRSPGWRRRLVPRISPGRCAHRVRVSRNCARHCGWRPAVRLGRSPSRALGLGELWLRVPRLTSSFRLNSTAAAAPPNTPSANRQRRTFWRHGRLPPPPVDPTYSGFAEARPEINTTDRHDLTVAVAGRYC